MYFGNSVSHLNPIAHINPEYNETSLNKWVFPIPISKRRII